MKAPKRILVASGNPRAYEIALQCIARFYKIDIVEDGWAALDRLGRHNYYAVILDSDLPGRNGFQIAQLMQETKGEDGQPPVMLVAREDLDGFASEHLSEICYRHIYQPFSNGAFLSTFWDVCDKAAERHWQQLNPVQISLLRITRKNITKIFREAAESSHVDMDLVRVCSKSVVAAAESDDLGGVLDELKSHHSYSFVHSLKVASIMVIFGKYIGLKKPDLHLLAQGGLMHDIGKCRISDELLNKPTALEDEEWQEMRRHPDYAELLLGGKPEIPIEVFHMATRHHEKMDGTGYPYGLKGGQIDDLSLITAITDVYSALVDKRSYKSSFPLSRTVGIMRAMSGHHLEAGFLTKFLEMVQQQEVFQPAPVLAAD